MALALALAAVARAELPWWSKLAVFVGELLFAALVIMIELLTHGRSTIVFGRPGRTP
ncbi:hypothetical protein N1027_12110 [Herbiconiux sp. CPCC 205763]|uniref:Uncharacterized protein n=1 Tax=Herbiconiux aconitum TaxID=2970913 RepID=A0ABT2GVB7_9MICO|nr:hypothetical protein [Herbiconiux aconitum]MCS5718879.1 hypothetical protein [Herbiconiux aconitum]